MSVPPSIDMTGSAIDPESESFGDGGNEREGVAIVCND